MFSTDLPVREDGQLFTTMSRKTRIELYGCFKNNCYLCNK